MPTSFDNIEDLALITIRDYKIDKLYNLSQDNQQPEQFQRYLDGFLLSAIPNFDRCIQSLEFDLENREFLVDLSLKEQSILADLWIIEWFSKETQDAVQINNKLQVSSAFTTHSAAQNLKEKSVYLDKLKETLNLKITQYQLSSLFNLNKSASNFFEGLT